MTVTQELIIARVGAQGDGVADSETGSRYVPFTLAGECVRATFEGDRGKLDAVLQSSSDRVPPVCRHFGSCGGCALQHMAPHLYVRWKREQVVAAFRQRGIDVPVADLVCTNGRRRRAVFSARRATDGIALGFHEAQSHDLIDIQECPVLELRIVEALPGLRKLLQPVLPRREEARVIVTMAAAGLDVAIEGVARTLSPDVRSSLATAATAAGIARVSVEGETVYEALAPFLVFGGVEIPIRPGVFIQAVGEAEHAMAELVFAALGKVKTVADLFSGAGAFTLPIAAKAKVFAVDSDRAAISALAQGIRRARGIKPITTLVRDLFREPLSALELNEYDAVVFDPPRAGAEAQSRMLAKSKVKTVIAVSCNPATLARDARILIDGGYCLERVTPIDQFQYSPHVEAIGVFRR